MTSCYQSDYSVGCHDVINSQSAYVYRHVPCACAQRNYANLGLVFEEAVMAGRL